MNRLEDAPPATSPPHRAQRVRRQDRNRLVAAAVVGGAAGTALIGSAGATSFSAVDVALRAAFGASVAMAGVRARWGALLWLGAVAVAFAGSSVALVAGGGAFLSGVALAIGDHDRQRRRRVWQATGALGAGLGAIAVVNLDDAGATRLSAAAAVLAVVPVLVSGYRNAGSESRHLVRRVAFGACIVSFVVVAGFAIAAIEARASATRGAELASEGLTLVRAGDSPGAADKFRGAEAAFGQAQEAINVPWARPASVLPGLAPNAEAIRHLTAAGSELSASASRTLADADYRKVQPTDGRIDLEALRAMAGPVTTANQALDRARVSLNDVDTTWVVPPLRGPLDELRSKVVDAREEGSMVADGLEVLPALLGAEGSRQYFIAFTTPAETRSLGGFIGSWAILRADGGRIQLAHHGPIRELSDTPGPRSFADESLKEFGFAQSRWTPTRFFENLTAGPDFPTDARAIKQLYSEARPNEQLDGVFVIDPYGLAALLELTGPVTVEGMTEPLTKDNAVDYLLVRQYAQFTGKGDQAARKDLLGAASRATFEALTSRKLPGPSTIGRVLGPSVRQGRLRFTSFRGPETALASRLGLNAPFGYQPGIDQLSVRTSNSAANKLDVYLQRDVTYDVNLDAASGLMTATATVRLTNTAPAGLDDYVASADMNKLPKGTNTQYVTIYSPLLIEGASIEGVEQPIEPGFELGLHSYTTRLDIPQGQTRTYTVKLKGPMPDRSRYDLRILRQPVVRPDHIATTVSRSDGGPSAVIHSEQLDATEDHRVLVPLTSG